ncbi:MLO-like protein 4 isoform X1 [Benincasa hispida]|uniref:MLO-like protein 4 isoform X1 n=1 Tax=Benincasa hispida TaxID=102211 RepID=UPI0018FFF87E|nr:MLO-like protein 4 isoform X1 [Benincasa hispida]
MGEDGRSLAVTPTWAFATVVTLMVSLGFFFQGTLKRTKKWLDRTKRKSLLAALEKIKEELMLFGLLSLLMGHWIVFVARICVKSSVLSSRFYPCALEVDLKRVRHISIASENLNISVPREHNNPGIREYCPEGRESFASYESLEQLHRLIFVLGVTHVSYSFIAIALAMIKIYGWRAWENEAKTLATRNAQESAQASSTGPNIRRLSTFVFHHTSHPWSQHRVLVWLLCFSRQFWSSINRADYMALRLGFISTHELPISYDFHNYMLRSMDDEFRDMVGISVPLWIYAIACIFLNFHGSNIYFWLSFLPAILILLIGTKLHRVVVKLAVEVVDTSPRGYYRFNLRDELFWFGKPKLLLWLIQFISFQNAFEMATFIWSLWEIKEPSCFMDNETYVGIRLAFGVITQFWCSFITFPLYVIVTQMGSKVKKSLVSENVRNSLHQWKRRVKARPGASSSVTLMGATSLSSSVCTMDDHGQVINDTTVNCSEGSTSNAAQCTHFSQLLQPASSDDTDIQISVSSSPPHITSNNRNEGNEDH